MQLQSSRPEEKAAAFWFWAINVMAMYVNSMEEWLEPVIDEEYSRIGWNLHEVRFLPEYL